MSIRKQTSNPLKWHGGKTYLAKEIIKRFPPHIHYVEPYFGGGAVLFAKPDEWIEGHSEVVNDINSELMNFWNILASDYFDELIKELSFTPFSQAEFRFARKPQDEDATVPIYRAKKFFVRYRQSRQGLGKDFATLSKNRTRRGMNEQVSAWLSAIDGLPEAHERLKRVAILNDDALKVIKCEDGPNTFFYLDPPYLHETRQSTSDYEYEMDFKDHELLLECISNLDGKFLLSGYHSDLYDEFAEDNGWSCDEIKIDNKSSSKQVKEIKTECLWRNY